MMATKVPCPRWCTRPSGHPFVAVEEQNGRVLLREHERVWMMPVPHVPPVEVALTAEEEATSAEGPTVLEGPHVRLDVSRDARLTTAQARRLAAALLNAVAIAEAVSA